MKSYWVAFAAIITAALISLAYAQATDGSRSLPQGWIKTGSAPGQYEMSVQPRTTGSTNLSFVLKSKADADANKFGTLMQQFQAADYRGQSVRFSANVKARDVTGSGQLWMRVDDENGKVIAFDNMDGRAIKGTTSWARVEVVLPVASNAHVISFGTMMQGKGEFAITDLEITAVPSSTPSTAPQPQIVPMPVKPINLDFKQ